MTVGELMRIQMGISEVFDDDDFVIVGDVDIGEGKQSENDELGSGELRKKKRKKEKVAGELKGEKRLKKSAKAKDDAELNGEKVVGEKKLKRSSKAGEEDGATAHTSKGAVDGEGPAWALLRDNYILTNPKLKYWDKIPDTVVEDDIGRVAGDSYDDD
ncbi:hypothetical protein ACFX2B_029942 [Malus domestica]